MSAPPRHVLVEAINRMDAEDRAVTKDMLDHYRREWRRIRSEHAPSVAHTLHDMIDNLTTHLLARSDTQPSCRKGCAACCHLHVDVSAQEAELLMMFAKSKGMKIDTKRLARQAQKSVDTWNELSHNDKRCVFLDDSKACAVYEHRPAACRKYLVASEPEWCDQQRHPGSSVRIMFDIEAEIMYQAALDMLKHGSMARMLQGTGIKL